MDYRDIVMLSYGGLQNEIRIKVPRLSQQLSQVIAKVPSDPSSSRIDRLMKELRETFIPDLLSDHGVDTGRPGQEIFDLSPEFFYGTALSLGVISLAIPESKLVLFELANIEHPAFRTASLLTLLYCDIRHPNLEHLQLAEAVESMMLFRIPLPMFQKILPQLESNFLQDEKSLNSLIKLVDRRHNYNPFDGEYIYTEVMIFLAYLNVFLPRVINELIMRQEWLRPNDSQYVAYVKKCHQALGKLIASNTEAFDYYINYFSRADVLSGYSKGLITSLARLPLETALEKCTNLFHNDLSHVVDKSELEALDYLESGDISPYTISELSRLGEILPLRFYKRIPRAIIRMMNDSRFKEQLLSWILASLEDDETQYIRSTLEELIQLKQPEDSIKEKILTLIEFEGDDIVAHRIREAAVELAGKWGIEQARQSLTTLTQVTEEDDRMDQQLAERARQALVALNTIGSMPN